MGFGRRRVEKPRFAQGQEHGLETRLPQMRGRGVRVLALAQDEKARASWRRSGPAQRRQPSKKAAPASSTRRSAASSAICRASARVPSTRVSCIRVPSGVRIIP